ncbi:NAD-dependent epimerase/dehydratase family protein [Bosea sp. MMO-172]|uniref:NAD-dependent epimerase/dehydratase family protein n=1 Tax=Bosea sp. MMO-172 TaxID=3127885 RepID=UPI003017CC34
MTRNVLVTGAGGFVGRPVVRELLSRGHAVTLTERPSRPVCLDGDAKNCRRLQTDDLFAATQEWWVDACAGIDTVIHLAWFTMPGRYQRAVENLACVEGTIRLARGAAQAGVSRFVGIGTCAEYDVSQCLLSIDTPLRPTTLYGSSKAASFLLLSALLAELNISFAWCRLFYLYGAGEHEDRLLPHVRRRLAAGQSVDLSEGNQIRDFIDVKDAARMIVDVALGSETGAVNICSGVPRTVRQLVEQVADEYDRRDLLRFGARPNNDFDPPCVLGRPGGKPA